MSNGVGRIEKNQVLRPKNWKKRPTKKYESMSEESKEICDLLR
jgi:hypothetical protein